MRKLLSLTLAVLMLLSCLSIVSCDSSDSSIDNSHSHSYGAWQTTKAATCESAGEQSRLCSCGDIQTAPIPATAHSWEPATYTSPKTCSMCGITQGEPLEKPTEAPEPEPQKIKLTKDNFDEYFSISFTITELNVKEHYNYVGTATGSLKIYPLKNITVDNVKISLSFDSKDNWIPGDIDLVIPYDGTYDTVIGFSIDVPWYVTNYRNWKVNLEKVYGNGMDYGYIYVIEG